MKIGIIQQSPDMGGAETYMLSLIEEFLKQKDQIYFATNKGKFFDVLDKNNKIDLETIPYVLDIIGNYKGLIKSILLFPFATFYYLSLLRRLKNKKVEVILMSGFSEKMLISFLLKFFNISAVWIEYGPLDVVFKRNFGLPLLLYRLFDNIPQKIIVPARNTYSSLERFEIEKNKLQIIPLGTKIGEIGILSNDYVIGNVSRLTREKGQQYLIKAMPKVLEHFPSARLVLVGRGPDRKYFEDLIRKLNLEKSVELLSYQEDLDKMYRKFRVFVFPSDWELEGFGLVLIEAMARGIPVIASNHGPVPEIIRDGKNGVLFTKGSSSNLLEKIVDLITDSTRLENLRVAAYKRAKEEYNITKSAQNIKQVLINAVN